MSSFSPVTQETIHPGTGPGKSIHAVKSHVYSLYRKMDVTSRHQLIHRIGVYGGGENPSRLQP